MNSKFYIAETVNKVASFVQEKRLPLVGEYVATNAKYLCPVGKYPKGTGRVGGRLRGSITWATSLRRSKVNPNGNPPAKSKDSVSKPSVKLILRIGTNVEYAAHVELGTGNKGKGGQKAQPYLRPAVELYKKQITKLMKL